MSEWNMNVQRIIDLVERNLRGELTLGDVSRRLGYSPWYCTHQFSRVVGMSLRRRPSPGAWRSHPRPCRPGGSSASGPKGEGSGWDCHRVEGILASLTANAQIGGWYE